MSVTANGIPIPSWLETHATEVPPPPVTTKLQVLPFQELTWENYERLCLRYIRLQGTAEFCQAYGVKGQAQEGIDFYVRLNDPLRYAVYQCKRILDFTPSEITNAVTSFLDGSWSKTASLFVICASQSTTPTQFARVVETETERLRGKKIDFHILDQDRLSERLKDHPVLVDDFFGRPWAQAFCAEEGANRVAKRLSGEIVVQYRRQLAEFYRFLFVRHDPPIPVPR